MPSPGVNHAVAFRFQEGAEEHGRARVRVSRREHGRQQAGAQPSPLHPLTSPRRGWGCTGVSAMSPKRRRGDASATDLTTALEVAAFFFSFCNFLTSGVFSLLRMFYLVYFGHQNSPHCLPHACQPAGKQ